MAKFQKGTPKLGGREKGVANKVTQDARKLFTYTLERQVVHIHDAFMEVREKDPAKFLELFAKYAQYFVPKQVDITTNGEQVKQVFKIGNVEVEL